MSKFPGSRKKKLDPPSPVTSRSRYVSTDAYALRSGKYGMLLRSGLRLAVPVPTSAPPGAESGKIFQSEDLSDSKSGDLPPDSPSRTRKEGLAIAEAEPSPEDYGPALSKDPEDFKKNIESRAAWRLKLKAKYSKPLEALPPRPAMYQGDDPNEIAKNMLKRQIWRYQNQAWMKQQLEKRRASSGSVEVRRIKPPAGLTPRDLDLIRPYLVKQSFEVDGVPVPDKYVEFKAFLDQVRISPYNVKVSYRPNFYASAFNCLDKDKFKENPWIRKHLKDAIRLVIRAIKDKMEQKYKAVGGFNNFIQIKWHYLLSQDVKNATGTLQTVEAHLCFTPVRPLELLEWKLKQDSKVIFCTEDTTE